MSPAIFVVGSSNVFVALQVQPSFEEVTAWSDVAAYISDDIAKQNSIQLDYLKTLTRSLPKN
jgi:hypothetical protein